MKTFNAPAIEVEKFMIADVITASEEVVETTKDPDQTERG